MTKHTIEENLERIADALERIASFELTKIGDLTHVTAAPAADKPAKAAKPTAPKAQTGGLSDTGDAGEGGAEDDPSRGEGDGGEGDPDLTVAAEPAKPAGKKGDAKKATLDDVRGKARELMNKKGKPKTFAVLARFKTKDGAKVQAVSDLQEKDYSSALVALEMEASAEEDPTS